MGVITKGRVLILCYITSSNLLASECLYYL